MLIRSLELRNFRAFETLKIELNPKLSVIVGQNGTGKTTILEAAAIASGTLLHGFDGVANYGIKKSDAHYKYFDMGSVIDVQPQFPVEVSAWGSINTEEKKDIRWTRSLNSERENNGGRRKGGYTDFCRNAAAFKKRRYFTDSSGDCLLWNGSPLGSAP